MGHDRKDWLCELSTIDLTPDWMPWTPSEPITILEPGIEYEGAGLPLEPSKRGWAPEPVRQLRDPGIFAGRARLVCCIR
jgi:hypothetical protein